MSLSWVCYALCCFQLFEQVAFPAMFCVYRQSLFSFPLLISENNCVAGARWRSPLRSFVHVVIIDKWFWVRACYLAPIVGVPGVIYQVFKTAGRFYLSLLLDAPPSFDMYKENDPPKRVVRIPQNLRRTWISNEGAPHILEYIMFCNPLNCEKTGGAEDQGGLVWWNKSCG